MNEWWGMAKRYALSKKEKKKIIGELSKQYPSIEIDKDLFMEFYEEKGFPRILIIEGVPAFFEYKDKWAPHLKYLLKKGYEWAPYVVVDMGAVKPLLRGADIMAPGIREVVGEFGPGDIVVVIEEKYRKPFVVGESLVESKPLADGEIKRGKVILNIHRAGDKLWDII